MDSPSLILVPGKDQANAMVERRQRARRMVDAVLQKTGPARWKATRALWFIVDPEARQDHIDAVAEAAHLRKTILDPKFGRSRQTLGIAHGERGNKNTDRRLVAVLPANLKDMLKRFDPFVLGLTKGKEYRENWRKVYKTFPEYRVAEKI